MLQPEEYLLITMTETFFILHKLRVKYVHEIEKSQQAVHTGVNNSNVSGSRTKRNNDMLVHIEWLKEQLLLVNTKIENKLSLRAKNK